MFIRPGSDIADRIRFNAGGSLTQIFWRKAWRQSLHRASSTPKVDFVSPQLAAAMSHPTRVAVMGVLVEGPGLTARAGGRDRRAAEQRHLPREAAARARLHRARPHRAAGAAGGCSNTSTGPGTAPISTKTPGRSSTRASARRDLVDPAADIQGHRHRDGQRHLLRRRRRQRHAAHRSPSTPRGGRKSPTCSADRPRSCSRSRSGWRRGPPKAPRPRSTPRSRCCSSARPAPR